MNRPMVEVPRPGAIPAGFAEVLTRDQFIAVVADIGAADLYRRGQAAARIAPDLIDRLLRGAVTALSSAGKAI
jgi:hypothetical protein